MSFYFENNDTPGLQTGGFTGDYSYGSVNVQNGVATLTLDTTWSRSGAIHVLCAGL